MKKRLDGKWALVTGSSRGIGQQVALGLAQLGCHVIVHGRTLENCDGTLVLLKDYDVKVVAIAGELNSESNVNQLIASVNAITAELGILYNNAAMMCEFKDVFEFSQVAWKDMFQVNVLSMVQLCNAFGPGMKARNRGRIVNVSSGIADQPSLAPYSVSKAAVDKLTKDLASEFKDTAVRVNAIDPGWIQTELGGPDAWEPVESVLPGMMAPVIVVDDGANGEIFSAQNFKHFD